MSWNKEAVQYAKTQLLGHGALSPTFRFALSGGNQKTLIFTGENDSDYCEFLDLMKALLHGLQPQRYAFMAEGNAIEKEDLRVAMAISMTPHGGSRWLCEIVTDRLGRVVGLKKPEHSKLTGDEPLEGGGRLAWPSVRPKDLEVLPFAVREALKHGINRLVPGPYRVIGLDEIASFWADVQRELDALLPSPATNCVM
jgi:hypothetical protein